MDNTEWANGHPAARRHHGDDADDGTASHLEKLVRHASQALGFEFTVFYPLACNLPLIFHSASNQPLELQALTSLFRLPLAQVGGLLHVPDCRANTEYCSLPWVLGGPEVGSLASIAIEGADRRVMGTLTLFDDNEHLLSLDEIVDLRHIATQMQRKLRQHQDPAIDPLTGVYTRHYFSRALTREWHRAERIQLPLHLALIEIDRLGVLTEIFGHDTGEVLLTEFGRRLQEAFMRSGDVIARVNAEQFAIILPASDEATALERLESLRELVNDQPIKALRGAQIELSVSIGVSSRPTDGARTAQSPAECLKRADRALKSASAAGGNQLVSDSPGDLHDHGQAVA